MTALSEFLKEQSRKYQADADAAKAVVDEWRSAVERLFAQVRDWLKQADTEGVIEIKESEEDIREPRLCRYRIPRLDVRVFGKWVGIIPKARRTVGAASPPQKSAPER